MSEEREIRGDGGKVQWEALCKLQSHVMLGGGVGLDRDGAWADPKSYDPNNRTGRRIRAADPVALLAAFDALPPIVEPKTWRWRYDSGKVVGEFPTAAEAQKWWDESVEWSDADGLTPGRPVCETFSPDGSIVLSPEPQPGNRGLRL